MPPGGRILPARFYARDPVTVARSLLGKLLVHDDPATGGGGPVRRAARIVETEAYGGEDDAASHARFGPTPRARIMWGPPGRAYVYLIYGRSHCFNVVTGRDGEASAVLVRAAEPVAACLHGTSGPGNLCRALAITRAAHDGADLTAGPLLVLDAPAPVEPVLASPRVGVAYAGADAARPWRFTLAGNLFVSRPRPR